MLCKHRTQRKTYVISNTDSFVSSPADDSREHTTSWSINKANITTNSCEYLVGSFWVSMNIVVYTKKLF